MATRPHGDSATWRLGHMATRPHGDVSTRRRGFDVSLTGTAGSVGPTSSDTGSVLVIGAGGVIGAHAAAEYARRPGWRVRGLSRRTPREATWEHLAVGLRDGGTARGGARGAGGATHPGFAGHPARPPP